MKQGVIILAAGISMLAGSAAQANKHDRAIHACKRAIHHAYGVSNFRDVFTERTGRDRFRVWGKVKERGDRYPFNCRVKRGRVQSYHYDAPYSEYDYSSDDDRARNIALGVGLAALAAAAIAASSNNQPDDRDAESSLLYPGKEQSGFDDNPRYRLEDSCGQELGARIRREHDGVERIEFHRSQVENSGWKLTGYGRILWQHYEPSALEFSCSFDGNGRLTGSSYSYY